MKPARLRYLVVALALGSASAQSKQGIDDADIWAATHYSDALTLLFPVPTYEDARTNAMKWFISVTASPDGARLFDPERQYILIRSDTGEVKLRERTIVGGRLGEQLASGSRKNPSLNVAQAIQDIRTEDVTIADLQCPQLRRLAKELEHLETVSYTHLTLPTILRV